MGGASRLTSIARPWHDDPRQLPSASHIDRPPLGDLVGTLLCIIVGSPQLDVIYRHHVGDSAFVFDTSELREILGREIPFSDPEVLAFIRGTLNEGLASVVQEAAIHRHWLPTHYQVGRKSEMKSLEELQKIKERALQRRKLSGEGSRARVVVAMGTCGIAAGARDTMTAILGELEKRYDFRRGRNADRVHRSVRVRAHCAGPDRRSGHGHLRQYRP